MLFRSRRDDVDVVVEVIGGTEGAGADAVIEGLKASKAVVTANKALVAERGAELAALIAEHGGALYYEAAVAGGIPAIKGLREGLVANRIVSVAGILNGTCNFILTKMKDEKRAFDDVLAEAQALGYAEADPSFDIDGVDAAHKLAILSAVAFGGVPDFSAIELEGIRNVRLEDIEMAEDFGYSLKLLGVAKPRVGGPGVRQYVAPVMVPLALAFREEWDEVFGLPKHVHMPLFVVLSLLAERTKELLRRHAEGREAREALEAAREAIRKACRAEQFYLVFSSGGSEADNTALLGSFLARRTDQIGRAHV